MNDDRERDRLARLMQLSQQKYGISAQADWRYESFFMYLQISPSYRLAHLLTTGVSKDLSAYGPVGQDFSLVLKSYEAFGDVWQTDFWSWWVKRAQFQFGLRHTPRVHKIATLQPGIDVQQHDLDHAQACLDQYFSADRLAEGKPGSLVVALPLGLDRAAVLRQVSKLIEEASITSGSTANSGQFKFLVNKVRRRTLDEARRVAWARAAAPKQPLYVIGNRVGIAAAYVTQEGKRLPQDNRRDLMVIVTSRHLRRALIFAENAARGKFPCSDEVDAVEFDFEELRSAIVTHRTWIKSELTRLKKVVSKKDLSANKNV
jgi:hypothetical protein